MGCQQSKRSAVHPITPENERSNEAAPPAKRPRSRAAHPAKSDSSSSVHSGGSVKSSGSVHQMPVRTVPLGDHEALKEKTADLEQQLESAQTRRELAERALEQQKDQILVDRNLPHEEQLAILKAEMEKLQPYGSTDASEDTASTNGFAQTAQAQARLIDQLESDIAQSHKEIQLLRDKYEKRVKRVRVSSAKQKAEASLQVFALKEQLSKMTSDYALVQEKLRAKAAELERAASEAVVASSAAPAALPQRPQTPREQETGLVVMLSAQIEDLEEELHQANCTIDELRVAASEDAAGDGEGEGEGEGEAEA